MVFIYSVPLQLFNVNGNTYCKLTKVNNNIKTRTYKTHYVEGSPKATLENFNKMQNSCILSIVNAYTPHSLRDIPYIVSMI